MRPSRPKRPLSGQEGRIGRIILLFLEKCAIQGTGLIRIDQHQNIVKAPVVIQHMLGIPDAVLRLICGQELTE